MAQNPKGGGLSGTFGGTSSATFGVQRTNDFMEKATWTLGIFISIMILLSIVMTAKPSTNFQTPKTPAKQEVPSQAPSNNTAPANTAPTSAPAQK